MSKRMPIIIYCSSLISDNLMNYLFKTSKRMPMQSGFKFHKLFVEGFSENKCTVYTISTIPIIQSSNSKRFWFMKNETINGVNYLYSPIINISYLKHFMVFVFSIFTIIRLQIKFGFKAKIVIDALTSSISLGALLGSILSFSKTIGIVTDMPQMLQQTLSISSLTFLEKANIRLSMALMKYYDGYVFLSDQMNKVINTRKKPFRIIEGLTDINMLKVNGISNKEKPRVILYAGGLYETYGVKMLIDSFVYLKNQNIQLSIYGDGDLKDYIIKISKVDRRIRYFGVVPNQQVVEAQIRATLLVNPRPSNIEFTKYSFPSKNLEYMASGTPLVTTLLPSMPQEYKNYVYIFKDESLQGFVSTFLRILSLPDRTLILKGERCRSFVLREKNNLIQSRKVLELFNEISY